MKQFSNESSFTLIELVIVIGILAVLAVVVIVVLNPSEFLKQSRDSTRMSDLQTINKSLGLYQADGGSNFGSTNKVYVSIPDDAYQTCASLGLPSLPTGWEYRCSNSTNYRKVDSNGWIPVNLTSISFGSTLDTLPIDPINTTSSGNYYTYVIGGSWEMTALFESDKYADKAINDGDAYPGVYNLRTSVSVLTPGIRDKGMVGYWKFDETSGTLYDSSGHGNNGTQSGGVTYGAAGKVGNALSFDGVNDDVDHGNGASLNFGSGSRTLAAWVNPNGTQTAYIMDKYGPGGGDMNYGFYISGTSLVSGVSRYDDLYSPISTNVWSHIVLTYDSNSYAAILYVNGILKSSANTPSPSSPGTPNFHTGDGGTPGYLPFNGLIDDVRIYNRALSAAEIAAIYNATK